ncbi:MAG TPA: hypothetical protein VFL84_02340 [Gammaproteobacteria bacterium]|nr:hypothetical protein [Gammaproteobacteria bacterium]
MKRALAGLAAIVALAWMTFHAFVIVLLVRSEVVPALAQGTFNIQTSSMILNRLWEGNELYWLIAAHAALVLILAVVAMRTARFAVRGTRRDSPVPT